MRNIPSRAHKWACSMLCVSLSFLQRCVSRRRSRVSAGLTYSSVALHQFTLTLSLQAQTQTTFGSTNPRLILRHHLKDSDQTDRFRVEIHHTIKRFALWSFMQDGFPPPSVFKMLCCGGLSVSVSLDLYGVCAQDKDRVSPHFEWQQNTISKFIRSLYGGQFICSVRT